MPFIVMVITCEGFAVRPTKGNSPVYVTLWPMGDCTPKPAMVAPYTLMEVSAKMF
jgi:hypothetical protein